MTSAKAQALLRRLLLVLYQGAYWFARSLLFRLSPNTSHDLVQEHASFSFSIYLPY